MKSKIAMIIGVFYESDLWLKHVRNLGYEIIATHPLDIKNKFYYDDIKDYIDVFYVIPYDDLEGLLQVAKRHDVEMLIPHPTSNDATIAAGYVNTQLKLKGVSYKAALLASSKYDFYKVLYDHDLPRPKFTVDDVNAEITYPCIVKPNYGAGSIGVKLIYTEDELLNFFETKDKQNGYGLTKPYDYYIIQEFIDGPTIMGCHAVVHNGKLTIFGRTYRNLIKEKDAIPYFYGQEFITSREPISPYTYSQIEKVVSAVGIDNCPFDLEVMIDVYGDVISFIELNLRPAEKVFNFIKGRGGYEYCIKEQVKLGTDLDCDFSEIESRDNNYVGVRYFRFKPGKIKNITWPELPSGTIFFDSRLTNNSTIDSIWNVDTAIKNGSLIIVGDSKEEVEMELYNFINGINIEYYKE